MATDAVACEKWQNLLSACDVGPCSGRPYAMLEQQQPDRFFFTPEAGAPFSWETKNLVLDENNERAVDDGYDADVYLSDAYNLLMASGAQVDPYQQLSSNSNQRPYGPDRWDTYGDQDYFPPPFRLSVQRNEGVDRSHHPPARLEGLCLWRQNAGHQQAIELGAFNARTNLPCRPVLPKGPCGDGHQVAPAGKREVEPSADRDRLGLVAPFRCGTGYHP